MDEGIGNADKMLGLPGLVVLEVDVRPDELVIIAETTKRTAHCPSCRKRAKPHDRTAVQLRDLHCCGKPLRLVVNKRRWRCSTRGCVKKTWTEKIEGVVPRALLTHRAGQEVTRQVGQCCRSVASVALEYGVGWDTVMSAVVHHGTPLVDDRRRVGAVRALGVDEHSYLSANPTHATVYATTLVDLDRRHVIDLFEGRSASKLRRWTGERPRTWRAGVEVVALDLTDTYRSGLFPHLSHALRVADPFHVVRVANRMVDQVRRRVQNETMGRRGHKEDPLYRARKLLIRGDERLDERGRGRLMEALRLGDPYDEVLGAWLAKEACRSIYAEKNVDMAAELLDDVITSCTEDPVAEIATFGRTLSRWRTEILNHHRTGASNGPTEGQNFCAKQVKRAGRGFTRFSHYRLRVLLYAGGVAWPTTVRAPRITSTRPH